MVIKTDKQFVKKFSFIYVLLTEFEVRTVSCGPSFFPFNFRRSKIEGKKENSLMSGTDGEDENFLSRSKAKRINLKSFLSR